VSLAEPPAGPVRGGTRPLGLLVGEAELRTVRALDSALEMKSSPVPGALAELDRRPPDLLLLDGRLPGEALDAVLERVGQPERADRPSVIVLADDAPGAAGLLPGLADRADDFVSATLGPEVLLARVRAALRVREMLGELARRKAEIESLSARLESLAARVSGELRLAAQIQRTLLPPGLVHPRVDLATEYLPAGEIGGDYYDVIPLDGGRLGLALGDVMGKGLPAALLAAHLKACLRAQLQAGATRPADALARVNRLFREVVPRGLFASLFFAVLDPAGGVLEYVDAGHEPAILLRGDGSLCDLDRGGAALGLLDRPGYETGHEALGDGDVLLLFSDGLSERAAPSGELFGRERLRAAAAAVRRDPARIALYLLLGEVQGWSGGREAEDDLTLILARVR
jgi:sigma-B regulation protein RsbU (phosphoserine phosphatase)